VCWCNITFHLASHTRNYLASPLFLLRKWPQPATTDVLWVVPTCGEGTGGVNYGGAGHVRCPAVGERLKEEWLQLLMQIWPQLLFQCCHTPTLNSYKREKNLFLFSLTWPTYIFSVYMSPPSLPGLEVIATFHI